MNDDTKPMTRQMVLRRMGLAALLAPVALATGCAPQPAPVLVQPAPPPPPPVVYAPEPPPVPRRRARG